MCFGGIFDYDGKKERLEEVSRELEDSAIWNTPDKAQALGKERSALEQVVGTIDKLDQGLEDVQGLLELAVEAEDEATFEEAKAELADLEARLDAAADAIAASASTDLPLPVSFAVPDVQAIEPLLADVRIGVARDAAFAFTYQANLDLLRQLGAELVFFSPLTASELPKVDSLYLPGGYPELYLQELAGNQPMRAASRAQHHAGKPLLAECGGMLYLLDSLTDVDGTRAELVGLLQGDAVMQKKLAALALQSVELPEGVLRGHTYHHSLTSTECQPIARGLSPNGGRGAEAVFRQGRMTASYVHFYFPSCPDAAAALLRP